MLGLDNPLNPMQILFINILMDGRLTFAIQAFALPRGCRPRFLN